AAQLCRRTVADEPAVLAGRGDHGDDRDRNGELHHEQRALGLVHRRVAHLYLRGLRVNTLCGPAGRRGVGVSRCPLLAVSSTLTRFGRSYAVIEWRPFLMLWTAPLPARDCRTG